MKAVFEMVLEGSALRAQSYEVRRLGPMLIELGELCERANTVLNRDDSTVAVRWSQDAEETSAPTHGALRLAFTLRRRVEGKTPNLFTGDEASELRLLELLGLAPPTGKTLGLLELLRWLQAGAPEKIEEIVGGWVRITAAGRDLEVPAPLVSLLQDSAVRGRVEGLLRPLRRKGIERLVFGAEGKTASSIESAEVKLFAQPTRRGEQGAGETLVDSTYLRALGIVKVPFRPNLKWVLGSEAERVNADMRDQRFLDRHQDGLTSYAAGDILTVRLRTTAVRTATGLRTDHAIVEVIGHLRRAQEAQQTHLEEASEEPS